MLKYIFKLHFYFGTLTITNEGRRLSAHVNFRHDSIFYHLCGVFFSEVDSLLVLLSLKSIQSIKQLEKS